MSGNANWRQVSGHDPLAQATDWFLRVRSESARAEDLSEFQRWLMRSPANRLAYRQVAASWSAVGAYASALELVVARCDALEDAPRASALRWARRPIRSRRLTAAAIAASFILVLSLGIWTALAQRSPTYVTDLGERRIITLSDGSVVTLDAHSRVRVNYRANERFITLEQGQARFDVAKDSTRPFRVRAGAQTVIALGTQFNVELVAGKVLVTLIEGRIAVTGVESTSPSIDDARKNSAFLPALEKKSSGSGRPEGEAIELHAGESLRVRGDGRAVIVPIIDVNRATAWQSGKMFFDNEPLSSAIERVNRYSHLQIEADPAVANLSISGVFNAGNPEAFAEAVITYFPVQITRAGDSTLRLTAR